MKQEEKEPEPDGDPLKEFRNLLRAGQVFINFCFSV